MTDDHTRLLALIHQELGVAPERITPDARLDELGDSLGWVSLLSAIEADFDLQIDMAKSLALVTVADLLRLVEEPALA